MSPKLFAVVAFGAAIAATSALAEYEVDAPAEAVPVLEKKSIEDAMEEMASEDENIELSVDEHGNTLGMVMLSDVIFEFGDAQLSDKAIATLEIIAKKLPSVDGFELIGHTDNIGTEAFNLQLGQERSEAVMAWLVANDYVEESALNVTSAGESEPVAANRLENGADNPEGRAQNRRVEFRILTSDNAEEPELQEVTERVVAKPASLIR